MISAIVDVEQAGIGVRMLRVEADDDWLTASQRLHTDQAGDVVLLRLRLHGELTYAWRGPDARVQGLTLPSGGLRQIRASRPGSTGSG